MSESSAIVFGTDDVLAYVASKTGFPIEKCTKALESWHSTLIQEMSRRCDSKPSVMYAALQTGDTKLRVHDDLRPDNWQPGDFYSIVCKATEMDYTDIVKIMKATAEFLTTSVNDKFYEPIGRFTQEKGGDYSAAYTFILRRDLLPEPTAADLIAQEDDDLGGVD